MDKNEYISQNVHFKTVSMLAKREYTTESLTN